MPDTIGRISVPTPTASGLTFPFVSDFGYGTTRPWPVIEHRFGELATLATQRYQVGIGPRKFAFRRQVLSRSDRATLLAFYESVQGSFQSFTYNAPNPDKSTTAYSVIFETQPIGISELANACQVGLNFIECVNPADAPTYSITSTCLRFPSTALQTALLSQVQKIIPLVHIRVRDLTVPDIYLSDRRCTVGGTLYLPRLLGLGEAGSDVILSQDIKGTADNVQFVFGNADRAMTALMNDTDLKYASIDLSLYHVNSGILLQLWKGFIQNYVSSGTAQFPVQASDGLFQINQQYPARVVSRTCWKTYNDGLNCPWSSVGASAGQVIANGGDPTQCDYNYDSVNGCHVHGMDAYFGGQPVSPQGVVIKDNSTGILGIGRNTVTATSIVGEAMWGAALQEIWCNSGGLPVNTVGPGASDQYNAGAAFAFMVNCIIADVRDEGDFFAGIAIVGAGPIGFTRPQLTTNADGFTYAVCPSLDGYFPYGFVVNGNNTFKQTVQGSEELPEGLTLSDGDDPSGTATSFPIEFEPTTFTYGQPQSGHAFAAGSAFCLVRYSKPSGVSPTLADQHNMVVPVAQGLTGYVWDSNGNRSAVPGLTNPFWIAVNSYLRALGLFQASPSTQLAAILLSSINAGDGTGCAEIADLQVTPVVGTGTETQFQFQGVLSTQKPFRDWLTEIISCALGYYSFEFGQLRLGIRENASAEEAFDLGNMLFQSLKLSPIDAAFENMIISFADVEYQYQANTANYEDKTHEAYYGRAGSPLTVRKNSVGIPTVSQALRVCATLVREEVGGVDQAEWTAARQGSFGTTLLALNTRVGQVISITHPDCSGGVANFRIQSWKLKKDWSIEIGIRTVTDSMYDLDMGPKPVDVSPNQLPSIYYPIPQGIWAPFLIPSLYNDYLFPNEWSFYLAQLFSPLPDGTALTQLTIAGDFPINTFLGPSPTIGSSTMSISTTGGNIAGGQILQIVIAAATASQVTGTTLVLLAQIPAGTDTNTVTITGINWPSIAGVTLTQCIIFASGQADLICGQQAIPLTQNADGSYSPSTITLTGPLYRSTWGVPNGDIAKVRIKTKLVAHAGVIQAQVTRAVGNQIECTEAIDTSGIDAWAGRALIVVGRLGGSAPYITYNITSWDGAAGVFTLDRDVTVAGHPELSVQAGDIVVVATLGADNSANPLKISDAGFANATNVSPANGPNAPTPAPFLGLVPHAEAGLVARVIAGTNRGATAVVIDNDATSYTLATPLPIAADSVWTIEFPSELSSVDSTPGQYADFTKYGVLNTSVTVQPRQMLMVSGFTVLDDGTESSDADAPLRLICVLNSNGAADVIYPWSTVDPPTPIVEADDQERNPNFGLYQNIQYSPDNQVTPQFVIVGEGIVNVFSTITKPPSVSLSTTNSGGAIPGGTTVTVGVWAQDANGDWTQMALASLTLPLATNTNTVTATVVFNDPVNDSGWVAITTNPAAGWYGPNALAIPTGANSYIFTEIGDLATPVPDPNFDHFVVEARTCYNCGSSGNAVRSITGNTLGFQFGPDDANFGGDLTGRILSVLQKFDPTQRLPICDVNILGNTTDTITVDDVTQIGLGDVVFVRLRATTFGPSTIGDSYLASDSAPGLVPSAYQGKLVMIVRGTGAGTDPVPIADNDATTITTAIPFEVTPDGTSEWAIIDSSVDYTSTSNSLQVSAGNRTNSVSLTISVDNAWKTFFIQVRTADKAGNLSAQPFSPWREIFQPGFADNYIPSGSPSEFVFANPQAEFIDSEPSGLSVGLVSSWVSVNGPGGNLYGWDAVLGIPADADVKIDLLVRKRTDPESAAVSLFGGTPAVIPMGDISAAGATFSGTSISVAAGQVLQAVILACGSSANPGVRLTFNVYWNSGTP